MPSGVGLDCLTPAEPNIIMPRIQKPGHAWKRSAGRLSISRRSSTAAKRADSARGDQHACTMIYTTSS